jgi:hypothetical protein
MMNSFPGYFQQTKNYMEHNIEVLHTLKKTQVNQYNSMLTYFSVNEEVFLQLNIKKFCKITPTYALYAEINGEGMLNPHKDHNVNASLNYYVEAEHDHTIFYATKNSQVRGYAHSGQSIENIYHETDLNPVCKFVASSNQTYLLNVSEIHSVKRISLNPRIFVAFQWCNHTYQEVLENLV